MLSTLYSVSKQSQRANPNIFYVTFFYNEFIKVVSDSREELVSYESKALAISLNQEYGTLTKRLRTRKMQRDEARNNETQLVGRGYFKVNTHNVIFTKFYLNYIAEAKFAK